MDRETLQKRLDVVYEQIRLVTALDPVTREGKDAKMDCLCRLAVLRNDYKAQITALDIGDEVASVYETAGLEPPTRAEQSA